MHLGLHNFKFIEAIGFFGLCGCGLHNFKFIAATGGKCREDVTKQARQIVKNVQAGYEAIEQWLIRLRRLNSGRLWKS